MTKTDLRKLRDRWTAESLRSVLQLLRGELQNWNEVVGRVEGADGRSRYDLRGFLLTERLDNLCLNGLDLSYLRTAENGQLISCNLHSCYLQHSTLDTNLGDAFTEVDFSQANLNRAGITGTFERCRFTGATLRRCLGTYVCFESCCFTNADLRQAALYNCTFISCSFAEARFGDGSLADSRFINTSFAGIDLKDTILDGVRYA